MVHHASLGLSRTVAQINNQWMREYLLPDETGTQTEKERGNEVARNTPCLVRIGRRHCKKVGQVSLGLPLHFRKQAPQAEEGRTVTAFTRESQMRAMWTFEELLGGIEWTDFITLTYHEAPRNGKQTKQNLKRFLEKVERIGSPGACRAFWWMEFQRRGAIHFHIALSGVVRYIHEEPGPKPGFHWKGKGDSNVLVGSSCYASREWSRIIGQENRHTAKHSARWERVKNAVALPAYLAKYLAKKEQKTVPDCVTDVGRFWGTRGCADYKTAARGMAMVYVPAHLLLGTTEIFGPGACPFRFQWNRAEDLQAWANTPEGIAYQEEVKLTLRKHHAAKFTGGIYRNDRGGKMDYIGDLDDPMDVALVESGFLHE